MTDFAIVALIITWGIAIFPFVLKMINNLTDSDNFDSFEDCRRQGLICGIKIAVFGFIIPVSAIILWLWWFHY